MAFAGAGLGARAALRGSRRAAVAGGGRRRRRARQPAQRLTWAVRRTLHLVKLWAMAATTVPFAAPPTSSAASGRCCSSATSPRGARASASSSARWPASARARCRCACARWRRRAIVERHTYPEVPPRVEYALTEKGRALLPIIDGMRDVRQQLARRRDVRDGAGAPAASRPSSRPPEPRQLPLAAAAGAGAMRTAAEERNHADRAGCHPTRPSGHPPPRSLAARRAARRGRVGLGSLLARAPSPRGRRSGRVGRARLRPRRPAATFGRPPHRAS